MHREKKGKQEFSEKSRGGPCRDFPNHLQKILVGRPTSDTVVTGPTTDTAVTGPTKDTRKTVPCSKTWKQLETNICLMRDSAGEQNGWEKQSSIWISTTFLLKHSVTVTKQLKIIVILHVNFKTWTWQISISSGCCVGLMGTWLRNCLEIKAKGWQFVKQ